MAEVGLTDDTEAGATHLAPAQPASTAPTVEGMPGGASPIGRIPVMDVRPLVDGGQRPAKSVVWEDFVIRAKVFREGHDAVNAQAVLTEAQAVLSSQHRIEHATLQVEAVAGAQCHELGW